MSDAIALYTMIVVEAIPYGLAFAIGNLIVNTFLRMALGGRLEIGM